MSRCGFICCATSGRGQLPRPRSSAWRPPITSRPRAISPMPWAKALPGGWMSSDSSGTADSGPQTSPAPPTDASIFYDGTSSRRHTVQLSLKDRLEVVENGAVLAAWLFADIRRVDGVAGVLRLSCSSAPPLARLELRDTALAEALILRCPHLDDNAARRGVTAIIGWSIAATVSIVAVI